MKEPDPPYSGLSCGRGRVDSGEAHSSESFITTWPASPATIFHQSTIENHFQPRCGVLVNRNHAKRGVKLAKPMPVTVRSSAEHANTNESIFCEVVQTKTSGAQG